MRQWSKFALCKRRVVSHFATPHMPEPVDQCLPPSQYNSLCLSFYKVLTPTLGFEPNHPQLTKGASPGVGCYLRGESYSN